jgi:hypothetical protein
VAESFIPNPEDKGYVNHKDGVKSNNNVSNLEWVTAKENAQHAISTGLTNQLQKNQGRVKFSDEQIERVVDLVKKKGYTYVKAGSTEGMSYSTVAHIMTGRRRKVRGIEQYENNRG